MMETKNIYNQRLKLQSNLSDMGVPKQVSVETVAQRSLPILIDLRERLEKLEQEVSMLLDDTDWWIKEEKFKASDSKDFESKFKKQAEQVVYNIWHEITDLDKAIETNLPNQ